MKSFFSDSFKLYLQTVVAYMLCFVVFMSLNVVFTWAGTYEIGYQPYTVDSDGNKIPGETVYFEEGQTKSYPTDGQYTPLRSEQTSTALAVEGAFTQTVMLLLFIIFVNAGASKVAKKDRTAVMYQGRKEDLGKGFKLGLAAAIPSFILYAAVIICRATGKNIIQLEYYGNIVFMPVIQAITGRTGNLSDLSYLRVAALSFQTLMLPIAAGVSYILGYKNISFSEKIMYKKKEGK